MALHPICFDVGYPLPDDGQEIEWRAKGTREWRHAVVDFVWLSEDVPVVALKGGGNFIPECGDEWRPTPPPAAGEGK